MRCKIVKFQKLMWRNIMRSTKSQKVLVLHYSIDVEGMILSFTSPLFRALSCTPMLEIHPPLLLLVNNIFLLFKNNKTI